MHVDVGRMNDDIVMVIVVILDSHDDQNHHKDYPESVGSNLTFLSVVVTFKNQNEKESFSF